MSRRIFLNSGSFYAASNIFTQIIWKKELPANYKKTVAPAYESTKLIYSLSIYHSSLKDPEKAKGSERNLVFTVELAHRTKETRIKRRAALIYKIISSELIRKENIVVDELDVYEIKAELVSQTGDLKWPEKIEKTISLTIKPELSATIAAEREIYLSYSSADVCKEGL